MKLNFHKAHIRLWTWLAKNPSQSKCDWPEWEYNGGKIPSQDIDCFACEAYKKLSVCPLMKGKACRRTVVNCLDGLFYHYDSEEKSGRKSKLAEKIANLPWIGRKMYKLNKEGRVVK